MFGNGPKGGPANTTPFTNFVGMIFFSFFAKTQALRSKLKKPFTIVKGFYVAIWTGLELFLKMPYIKGLPMGGFLGAP
jgi:hypothetical protein